MPPKKSQSEPGPVGSKPGELKLGELKPAGLKPNQRRALLALLDDAAGGLPPIEKPSVAAAARQSGSGDRTLHRWLHPEPQKRAKRPNSTRASSAVTP